MVKGMERKLELKEMVIKVADGSSMMGIIISVDCRAKKVNWSF